VLLIICGCTGICASSVALVQDAASPAPEVHTSTLFQRSAFVTALAVPRAITAQAATLVAKPVADKPAKQYAIKSGDTLSDLFGNDWQKVHKANPALNLNAIKVGTVITVPDGVDVPSAKPAPAKAPVAAKKHDDTADSGSGGTAIGRNALKLARGKVGNASYIWGKSGPNAFDCSGLVYWAFKESGLKWQRMSASAMSQLDYPAVSKGNLQAGDIVFFYSPVSHVGIADGNGNVVHASDEKGDLKKSPVSSMPFHNAIRITD
jgi:cell wall-associated NlpC family hydrolase